MIILVDTREQLPYYSGTECARICLNTGDYTTAKLLHKFHIERKSPADLFGTITRGCFRFKKEVMRAYHKKTTLVVFVESSRKDFINKNFPRGEQRKVSTEALDKTINTFETKYFLEFVWCKDREAAKKKLYARLRKEERNHDNKRRTH